MLDKTITAIALSVISYSTPAITNIAINNMEVAGTNYASAGTLLDDGTGSMLSIDLFADQSWAATQETVFLDNTGSFKGTTISGPYDYDADIAAMSSNQMAVGIFYKWSTSNEAAILEIFDCVTTPGVCQGQGIPMDNGPFAGSTFTFSGSSSLSCSDIVHNTEIDTRKLFSITSVLSNCDNANGTLVLDSFDTATAAGGTVSNDGTFLSYLPPVDFKGHDSFNYTVKDNFNISTATISVQAGSLASNFTMLDPIGNVFGGTNDVVIIWDEVSFNNNTINGNNTPTDTTFNLMTIASSYPFFNFIWTAHHVRIFQGPGTFEIDVTCTTADYDAGIVDCDRPLADQGATQRFMNMTLGTGEVGAHILFDWGKDNVTTECGVKYCNTDIVNVWQVDMPWDNHGDTAPKNALWTGPAGGFHPVFVDFWHLVSTDFNGDGINASPMIDGALVGSYANFNYRPAVRNFIDDRCVFSGLKTDSVTGLICTDTQITPASAAMNYLYLLSSLLLLFFRKPLTTLCRHG